MFRTTIFQDRIARIIFAILCILLLSLAYPAPLPTLAAPQTITNGTQFLDISGNIVHAHGGGILQVGSYYYWFGENRNPDGKFRYVSAYRSTDLKNWEFRNNVLTQSSATELNSANIERPKVIFNSSTGRYVMWMHKENGVDYGEARAAVASSATVDGNYTYHGSFRPFNQHMSRDITLFNDNGTAYMISAANENYDLHIYRLTADYLNVSTLVGNFWPGGHREAPAMFKRGSTYFLLTSGATGWTPNQAKYATASNIAGPWSGWTNVGNSTTFDSQSTYVLPIQGSQTTSYLYMGDRWAGAWGGPVNDSSYVWLPISFPSNTSMSMSWYDQVTIDTATGTVQGGSDPNLVTVNDNTTGSGQNQFNYTGTWSYGQQSGAYQGDNHWNSTTNNAYQVAFTGSQVEIYAAKAPNHGIFAVSIDGGAETNVDLYRSTRLDQTLVWTSPVLTNASHTVRVRVTGTKNGSSSGAAIVADRITIKKTVGSVPTNTPVIATVTRVPTTVPTRTSTPVPGVTPTRTNTPVPPTTVPTTAPTSIPPTTGATSLKVQYKAADTVTGDNQIKPHFNIVNTGSSSVNMTELKIRYYFTKDNVSGLVFACDWAAKGCGNISGAFVATTGTNADTYLEVSFTSVAGSIAAGQSSGEMQTRINHSDWTNFNETNDYSFDATKTAFTDWTRVVLLRNGSVVWGTAP